MVKPLRAALVGCGAIACGNDEQWLRDLRLGLPLTHAGAYRSNPDITLVSGADVNRARAERFGADWGAAAYTDYKEMLRREHPDILSVCTPPSLHAEMVFEACRHGVRVIFCEKPLAMNTDQALVAMRACEESHTVLAVNHFRRWNPTLEAWRERLVSGKLGVVRRVNAYYTRDIVENGTHAIDLIHWLIGPIRSVRAIRWWTTDNRHLMVDALCTAGTEIPCYLLACRQDDFNILELDILTDRGRVKLTQNARRIESHVVIPDPHYRQYLILSPDPVVTPTAWQDCLGRAVEELVHCFRTIGTPRCSGSEGYAALRVAEAIRTSAASEGRLLELEELQGATVPAADAGKEGKP